MIKHGENLNIDIDIVTSYMNLKLIYIIITKDVLIFIFLIYSFVLLLREHTLTN